MGSRKKVRPTPVPSGPALLRPAVGMLVLSLAGAVEVGCTTKGEPPMNPPDPPMPPMVEPPMDDAPMPPPPMVAPMPEPMPPPVEGDSVDQEELPPMPPPPEGGFDGSEAPPPMPNPGNRPEPIPKTDATP